MKKTIFLTMLFCCISSAATAQFVSQLATISPVAEEGKDGPISFSIAAIVNGEIVSSQDMKSRIKFLSFVSEIPINSQTEQMLKSQALHSLVDEKIKRQEAKKQGISIPKSEIEDAVKFFAESKNMKTEDLEQTMKDKEISLEYFKSQLELDMLWARMVKRNAGAEMVVRPQEVEEAYKKALQEAKIKKYMISEIFISKEKAQDLDQLVKNVRGDNRFALYAMQFSEAPSVVNGGNIGWVKSGQLDTKIDDALKNMKDGDISDPIKVENGFYIIKLEKTYDPNKTKAVPDKTEVERMLQNAKTEAFAQKFLQKIRQQAVVEIRN